MNRDEYRVLHHLVREVRHFYDSNMARAEDAREAKRLMKTRMKLKTEDYDRIILSIFALTEPKATRLDDPYYLHPYWTTNGMSANDPGFKQLAALRWNCAHYGKRPQSGYLRSIVSH